MTRYKRQQRGLLSHTEQGSAGASARSNRALREGGNGGGSSQLEVVPRSGWSLPALCTHQPVVTGGQPPAATRLVNSYPNTAGCQLVLATSGFPSDTTPRAGITQTSQGSQRRSLTPLAQSSDFPSLFWSCCRSKLLRWWLKRARNPQKATETFRLLNGL